jgi:glycosyltransferase involved in cell wall biosynthesis
MKNWLFYCPYNALYIKASIDSILNQTFSDFDLFIYDDCSIDNTAECRLI